MDKNYIEKKNYIKDGEGLYKGKTTLYKRKTTQRRDYIKK